MRLWEHGVPVVGRGRDVAELMAAYTAGLREQVEADLQRRSPLMDLFERNRLYDQHGHLPAIEGERVEVVGARREDREVVFTLSHIYRVAQ